VSAVPERVVEALAAHDRGWWLVALRGKRPQVRGWTTAPRATREQVEQWAAHDNVGVRTGATSGVIVIDVDVADASAIEQRLALPATWTVRTARGWHYYFAPPPGVSIRSGAGLLGEHVDVRGEGGQAVLPGSVHPETGAPYQWAAGRSPADLALVPLPAALVAHLTRNPRANERARGYARAALRAECKRVAGTSEGARHDQLYRSSASVGELVGAGVLDGAEARAALDDARRLCGLPDEETRTIDDGLAAGTAHPRDLRDISTESTRPKITAAAEHGRRRILLPIIPPFVPFPVDALPQPVSDAVAAHAAAIGCDESLVALPTLASLAAAIGNNRRIRLKMTWSEPPTIWDAAVGQSGVICKTPPFNAAIGPLDKIQHEAFSDYRHALQSYEADQVKYASDFADWKRLKPAKRGDPPAKPQRPKAWRIVVEDTTTEALAPILLENPRGALLRRDELSGWIRGFDQYKQGRGSDAARWLQLWNAGTLIIDRKGDRKDGATGECIYVPKANVSVCGTIQPEILSLSLGFEGFINGLAARLLLAMPPRRVQQWTEAVVDPKLADRVTRIFGRLLALAPTEDGEPVLIDMTPDAKSVWVEFYNEHNRELAMVVGPLASAMKKLEAYCARFALIFSMVRIAALDDDAPTKPQSFVEKCDVDAAVKLARWFTREAERVYAVLSESPEAKEQRELVEMIRRHGGSITARDLRRAGRRYTTTEAAAASLAQIVEDGVADWVDVPPGDQGGRPTRTCRLRAHVDGDDADESPDVSSTSGKGE